MTERDDSRRRARRLTDVEVDAALAAWPLAERDAVEWDELAGRVEDRIEDATPARSAAEIPDDALLSAPLAATADEPGGADSAPLSIASERPRPRRSFKELADLAKSTPPPPVSAPIDAPAPSAPRLVVASSEPIVVAPVAAPVQAVAAPQAVAVAVAPIEERKRGNGPLIGVVAALAVAAAAFVFVRASHGAHDESAKLASSPPPAATQPSAKPASPAPSATHDDAIDPMALPLASATTPAAPLAPLPLAPLPPSAPLAIASAAPAPSAATPASSDSAMAAASAAPSSTASLEDQMRQAAGPSVSATAPPAATDTAPAPTNTGSVPMRPSQGAVSGAIGAVMPAARACLDSDDPVSHATIVFRSDGSVKSVAIEGGIAGKPQEACVRAALMKARVPPFAQSDFMGFATVRPN